MLSAARFPPMPLRTAPALPSVAPIAPVARLAPFNHPDWLFEPKYDGFRGVFYLTRRGCAMYSKRATGSPASRNSASGFGPNSPGPR